MLSRRNFIKRSAAASMFVGLSSLPLELLAKKDDVFKLTILHTNDTHSRIDPFPEGSKYVGLGGAAKRASLVNQIRGEEEHVLLLDAGDVFQGTPYFNMYGGELEYKLMSEMKYDASTIGNHDFDAGIDGLVKQMPLANFPFLNANYGFADTALEGLIEPYKVIKKGKMKIGIFGVGIELDGLVPADLFKGVAYSDPLVSANNTAKVLRYEEKCDYVICLSHLGYEYQSNKISDKLMAANSEDIDLIIGGHTHTFMDNPVVVSNLKNEPVVINQVGWAGIVLGRLELSFNKASKKSDKKNAPVIISRKTIVN